MEQAKAKSPFLTIVLKDPANNRVLFSEKLHVDRAPNLIFSFFDQHFQDFAKESPKDFIIYIVPDGIPPTLMRAKLVVGEFIQENDGSEETFPYDLQYDHKTPPEPAGDLPDKLPAAFVMRCPNANSNKFEWEALSQSPIRRGLELDPPH
jgi:hypothetical protein